MKFNQSNWYCSKYYQGCFDVVPDNYEELSVKFFMEGARQEALSIVEFLNQNPPVVNKTKLEDIEKYKKCISGWKQIAESLDRNINCADYDKQFKELVK